MSIRSFSLLQSISAFFVHLFTASGAVIGLASIHFIYQNQPIISLWLMGLAVLVDAIDGTLARWLKVKEALPSIDGALLDNMIDYFNYVLVPCLFILQDFIALPNPSRWIVVILVALSSCYQFCQADAKTPDNFFKGFPSYWNIVVFFLFILQAHSTTNLVVLLILTLLIFIPIKYVYPSRLDNLSSYAWLKKLTLLASLMFGLAIFLLLWNYPTKSPYLVIYCYIYIIYYLVISLVKTFSPLLLKK